MAAISPRDAASALAYGQMTGRTSPVVGWDAAQESPGRLTPVPVSGLTGVTQTSAGGYHSLAVRSNGTVVAWGYNAYGQLGDGTTTSSSITVTVSGLTNIARVSAGAVHGVALRTDGTVVAWGYNGSGQLGDGTTTEHHTPVSVPGLSGMTQDSAGGHHTLANAAPPE